MVLLGLVVALPAFWAARSIVDGVGAASALARERLYSDALHSIIFASASALGETTLGVIVAFVMDKAARAGWRLRTLLLLPGALSPVVLSVVFQFFYQKTNALCFLAHTLGLPVKDYITRAQWTLPALIIADIWQWTPLAALIVMRRLAIFPKRAREAAKLDGAGEIRVFFQIALPWIAKHTAVLAALLAAFALGRFDTIYIFATTKQAQTTSETLPVYAYRLLFDETPSPGTRALASFSLLASFAVAIALFLCAAKIAAITRRRESGES
jgi:ABC-type sugar transport system permease subunit